MAAAGDQLRIARGKLGAEGEERAAEYLRAGGYEVLERNYRSKMGEIDIIAEKDGVLAFVEVKSWRAYGKSELEYSIDQRKRRRIVRTAELFLLERRENGDKRYRFDVVFVDGGDSGNGVHHIQDAFNGAVG